MTPPVPYLDRPCPRTIPFLSESNHSGSTPGPRCERDVVREGKDDR
jgi:hypothetical protein